MFDLETNSELRCHISFVTFDLERRRRSAGSVAVKTQPRPMTGTARSAGLQTGIARAAGETPDVRSLADRAGATNRTDVERATGESAAPEDDGVFAGGGGTSLWDGAGGAGATWGAVVHVAVAGSAAGTCRWNRFSGGHMSLERDRLAGHMSQ